MCQIEHIIIFAFGSCQQNFHPRCQSSRAAGLVFDALRRAQESTGNKWLLDSEYPGKTRVTWTVRDSDFCRFPGAQMFGR